MNGDFDGAFINSDAGPIVPDTTCDPTSGALVTVYPGSAQAPLYDALGTVGSRRVAQGSGGEGIVFFDANGANASVQPIALGIDLNRMASTTGVLGVVGVTLPDIVFQRYNQVGAAVGGQPLALGSNPSRDVAIAASAGAFLTVWSSTEGVTAHGVAANGQLAGPAFALDAVDQKNFSASIAGTTAGAFGILWVGYTFEAPGKTRVRTAFAKASTTAMLATRDISVSDQAREVVQLVKTPTGYAAILNEPSGPPDFTPYSRLLILDEDGNPTIDPPPILAGVVRALGLAVQGSELGVVVERTNQNIAFRPFNAGAQPLGPWVCLGTSAPSLNSAAIDADGAGYAVVFGSTQRAVALARIDRLGK